MNTKIVLIAGGSGSGKSTVAENILKQLSENSVVLISHDNYYRDLSHISYEERNEVNYDHPNSLETDLFVQHLQQLKAGKTVEIPTYDFKKHNRAEETITIEPASIIIVDGILILHDQAMLELADLKLFVDTPPDIRVLRRTKRDIEERGRTFEFATEQYMRFTRPMHQQFVEPSKDNADIIIPEGGFNTNAIDMVVNHLREMEKQS